MVGDTSMCATSVAKLARLGRCGDLAPPPLAGDECMTSNAFAVSSSSKPFKAGEVGAGGGAMLVSGRVAALEEEEEEEMEEEEEEEEEEEGMEEEEEEEEEKDGAEEGDGAWLDSCLLPSSFLFFFEG